ncbi:MAG: Omp28-related outer membrane protein [Prevotella sp.]|nr:Omp28-related outer membrane protein [Prevotella sp.]
MSRQFISFILSAVAVITATAQPLRVEGLSSTQRVLGYTLTDDIDINGAMFDQVGTFSIGALIGSDMLQPYSGCRVVGMRVAVAQNLGRVRTFIYDANDNFSVVHEQRQRLYEGWNNIFFNGDGYAIDGAESLFFGFDYEETQAMVDAGEGGLACVGDDTDGAFYLYGNYGSGLALYSIGGAGKLCVQLIVDVSSLPQNDMAITFFDTGFKYKMPGESIDLLATFVNVGRDTISNYDVSLQLDNDTPVAYHQEMLLPDGYQDTWKTTFSLPEDIGTGMHTLTLSLSAANGEQLHEGRRQQMNFAVYRNSMQRSKVYLEVYTDSRSPLSAMLNNAVAAMTNSFPHACVVNVHSQGTPLAIEESSYLEQLYAYTYPSFTVNRSYFPGEAYIAYDMNDYLPVFDTSMSAAILGDIVAQDLATPSFASINLSGSYDEMTRQLTIDAEGELLPEAAAIYGDLALTLIITEDNVRSPQVVYNAVTQRSTTNAAYNHNHVLRTFVTPPTGLSINTDGDSYSARFETTLNADWQTDNISVVALLTKAADEVTVDNVKDMDIVNATSISIAEINTLGIETVDADGITTVQSCYGSDGCLHSVPVRGLNIIRHSNGTVRKVIR